MYRPSQQMAKWRYGMSCTERSACVRIRPQDFFLTNRLPLRCRVYVHSWKTRHENARLSADRVSCPTNVLSESVACDFYAVWCHMGLCVFGHRLMFSGTNSGSIIACPWDTKSLVEKVCNVISIPYHNTILKIHFYADTQSTSTINTHNYFSHDVSGWKVDVTCVATDATSFVRMYRVTIRSLTKKQQRRGWVQVMQLVVCICGA